VTAKLPARRVALALAIGALLTVAAGAAAQRQFFGGAEFEPDVPRVQYDGRFTFARLRFTHGPAGFYYRGLPAWAHGYPTAERNLSRILSEISALDVRVDESVAVAMDDPQLFKYPVAYMTEAGFWRLTPAETAGLRAYLQKGGFVVFDDFRDDFFRGGGGWPNFEANMAQVIPGARFVDLEASHPIFHSFFEINSFDIVPQFYDRGRPVFRGLFENNDPSKRLMAIINFNTDVSNFWEFSATGFKPVDESNQAYKLGVNYVMYGLTH
jgi:hypothetical protein